MDEPQAVDQPVETRVPGGRGGWLTPFTSETGRAAAVKLHEDKAESVRQGILDAALRRGLRSDLEMVRLIAENRAEDAQSNSKTSVASASLIFNHGYPKPERATVDASTTNNTLVVMSDSAAAFFAAAMTGQLDQDQAE